MIITSRRSFILITLRRRNYFWKLRQLYPYPILSYSAILSTLCHHRSELWYVSAVTVRWCAAGSVHQRIEDFLLLWLLRHRHYCHHLHHLLHHLLSSFSFSRKCDIHWHQGNKEECFRGLYCHWKSYITLMPKSISCLIHDKHSSSKWRCYSIVKHSSQCSRFWFVPGSRDPIILRQSFSVHDDFTTLLHLLLVYICYRRYKYR